MGISKIAARTYRDAKGRKISAAEWIKLHGGAGDKEEKIRKLYFGKSPSGGTKLKKVPKLKVTGDSRYNFAHTSDKRIEIGREPQFLQNKTVKSLRQNTKYENRTNEPLFRQDRLHKNRLKLYEEAIKPKNKVEDYNIKDAANVVPGVILGAGLLSFAGAKAYDKISNKKKEGEKRERKQYTR